MGIRESLLNTITSVGNSDFVRIVTSAGASSKATVQNLFKSFETGLGAKSSLTSSDYIRVVGSDNNSYKQALNDVMSAGGAYQTHYASNNSNCNDFTTIGTYYGTYNSNTPLGASTPASGYLIVLPHPQTTSYVKQVFSRFNYDEVYMRTCNNGTWSSWVLMPTRAEVNALNKKIYYNHSSTTSYAVPVGGWESGNYHTFVMYGGTSSTNPFMYLGWISGSGDVVFTPIKADTGRTYTGTLDTSSKMLTITASGTVWGGITVITG